MAMVTAGNLLWVLVLALVGVFPRVPLSPRGATPFLSRGVFPASGDLKMSFRPGVEVLVRVRAGIGVKLDTELAWAAIGVLGGRGCIRGAVFF